MKQGDWGQWINWAFAWDIGNRKPKVSNENASRSERRRTKKEVDRRREKGKKEEERRERREKGEKKEKEMERLQNSLRIVN